MRFDENERTVITATDIPEITYENIVRQSSQEYRSATSSGRVYESCIGSGCSRSPSPLRREFWESNRAFPDSVIKRKALGLQGKSQAGEDKQQQKATGGGQGSSLTRSQQSREPLFVYNNDASESSNDFADGFANVFEPTAQSLRWHHTPSPRRPRNDHEFPDSCNLTVEVDVADDENETCRIVTANNSCANSPRGSLKVSVSNSPRDSVVDDDDCGGGDDCGQVSPCPALRSRSRSCSPRPPSSPYHLVDRGSSPVVIRSRSSSPRGGPGQGTLEVHTPERSVTVDDDDVGNLRVEISTSGENTPSAPSPIYAPCPAACCRKQSQSRAVTPPHPTPAPISHNIEISSDDGDMHIDWEEFEGYNLRLQVDLENSDDCSTPRRVNVRCSRSPPPKFRSRSPSKSPRSRSPTSRPAWDNSTRGASQPLKIVYESRFPSKSPTPKSRSPSPESRTPRKIEFHHETSHPTLKVDYEYTPEYLDSHSTAQRQNDSTGCRSRCSTPCRSRCSTPCRSRSSTPGKCRSTSSGSRSRSPQSIEIRSATHEVPQVTIYRDYLSSTEGSRSRSEPPSSVCSRRSSSSRGKLRRPKSRSATPPKSRHVPNSIWKAACSCCACEPVNRCSNGCSCCCCSCHGPHLHSSNHCHQLQHCHTPTSTSASSICSTSSCVGVRPPSSGCLSGCHTICHTQLWDPEPKPYCAEFCPVPGDILIRSGQRKPCPYSGKDDGQIEFFSHRSACGLREGDSVVRLGKFDSTGKWCASDIVGMYMLGSQGLWMFLGEEEGHECLRPMQADQHQSVRTINKWLRPRLGDLIIHTVPGPHSFYFWNAKKRLDCNDTRLLLRAYIGIPQVEDEQHNLSCCTESHLPVGYAELYVNVRNHWLFLGRDDHMFTECEITSSST
ncbi:hypothetical protein R1flu_025273 [Riccia fluitans]|uniref:Uncharacterized protein n=1 Tax=Riccia fluitans TaxID=41844 RepID=A0ABD1XXA5_9MARC